MTIETPMTSGPGAARAGGPQPHATCPLCHTADRVLTDQALAAGSSWRCSRCGQHWNARRLATVEAYAAWGREHDPITAR